MAKSAEEEKKATDEKTIYEALDLVSKSKDGASIDISKIENPPE